MGEEVVGILRNIFSSLTGIVLLRCFHRARKHEPNVFEMASDLKEETRGSGRLKRENSGEVKRTGIPEQ